MAEYFHRIISFLFAGIVWILSHLAGATLLTLVELFILFGPLFLAALLSHAVSRRMEGRVVQLLGLNGYIYFLGWLGTPVHEFGHAAMCILFRHRIIDMKLFSPDKQSGQIGYVYHAWDSRSFYQQIGNFFIAIGPIISGGLVLYVLGYLLLPAGSFHFAFDASKGVSGLGDIPIAILTWFGDMALSMPRFFALQDWGDWRTWLFLYSVLAIGSHVNLSPSDLQSGKGGLTIMLVLLFSANVVMTMFADVPLQAFWIPGRYLGYLSSLILACVGVMLPFWLLMEGLGLAREEHRSSR